MCVSVGCCQVEVLRRADHSPRGILPSVECLSVIDEPHRGSRDSLGLSSNEEKNSEISLNDASYSVPNSQKTQCISTANKNELMTFREMFAAY